jgi:hypothetical protein
MGDGHSSYGHLIRGVENRKVRLYLHVRARHGPSFRANQQHHCAADDNHCRERTARLISRYIEHNRGRTLCGKSVRGMRKICRDETLDRRWCSSLSFRILLLPDGASGAGGLLASMTGFALGGVMAGAITGIALVWLLRQTRTQANTPTGQHPSLVRAKLFSEAVR